MKGRHTGTQKTTCGEGTINAASSISPLQGLEQGTHAILRALPWAGISPPFRRVRLALRWRDDHSRSPAAKGVQGSEGRLRRVSFIHPNCGWADRYFGASKARPQAEPHRAI